MPPNSNPATDRQIRVFVSSTFRDMQEERDILIKKIFPQLRKMCEERAVTWTEVDLRWGITDEQKAEGKVLPFVLEEIHRCPYFIGLLGERYGWLPDPDSIPAELLESQPWLKNHLDYSVTELEILHGVLSEEAMHKHAFFYFRDPRYLDSVPKDKQQDFTVENVESAEKLRTLKQKIRGARDKQVCELRENYATPEQLGEWLLEDFTKLIDRLYPKDPTPDPLDQESARHQAYARSRRLAFVGREDLLHRLHQHFSAPDKPLVVVSECSGCGKSAMLAESVASWREQHPDDLVIQHYIGSTPDSADWQGLVRRILGELKRAFAITDDVPLQSDALRTALNDWTEKAAGSRRVVLMLDALNQIAGDDAGRQLGWLPIVFPANFRVLVSTLTGETLDALRKRGWPELNVPLFARTDIAPAARAYFKIFSKTPPPDIVAKLESTPAACNALYLRAVLDELRQFGKHEELHTKAADYLSAPDLPELFDRILTRWEQDYGADLVRQSLSLIWAARRGLSEAEILDLLGKQPACDVFNANTERSAAEMLNLLKEIREPRLPMPRAGWTQFFLTSESGFAMQAGLLTFSHSYLRAAVEKRYLPTTEGKHSAHVRLAIYFELSSLPLYVGADGSLHFQEEAAATSRNLDEEPWQLRAACRWEALANHLSCLPVFEAACATGRGLDWMQYWQSVLSAEKDGTAPSVDIPSLYLAQFRRLRPEEKSLSGGMLGQFLLDMGYLDAAAECFEEEERTYANFEAFNDESILRAGILNDKGLIAQGRGDESEALKYFEEATEMLENRTSGEPNIINDKERKRCLASCLMNKGSVTRDSAVLERALVLMKESTGERSPEVATVL